MQQDIITDQYYPIIACLHGITGLVIFCTAILQFIFKKGTTLHRTIGKIYLYSWIVILATGLYIGSLIIVAIVLMGFYLSVTGVRLAILKNNPYTSIDKTIILIAAFIVLGMLSSAIYCLIKQNYTYAIIAGFFSLLYSFVIILDVFGYILNKPIFKVKEHKMNWYINHLRRMNFSFLTAVGAFCKVQNVFGNTVLNFILPALIGTAFVRMSIRYFKKKLKMI